MQQQSQINLKEKEQLKEHKQEVEEKQELDQKHFQEKKLEQIYFQNQKQEHKQEKEQEKEEVQSVVNTSVLSHKTLIPFEKKMFKQRKQGFGKNTMLHNNMNMARYRSERHLLMNRK
jgi:Pyruvate/2-oxoacid:ferredoxin oxidoreductase gamma subunit